MHDDQHRFSHSTDPVPPLLAIDHSIFAKQETGVGEHARSGFKIDASVLLLV